MIKFFTTLGGPFQQFDGAVDGHAFLIAGDQEGNRTLGRAAVGKIIEGRCQHAGDRALHIDGTAAEQDFLGDLAGKRCVAPERAVARRHDVGMAREHEVRRPGPNAGVDVFSVVVARFGEHHAVNIEPGFAEHALQVGDRPAFFRRHGRAADQLARKRDGIGSHAAQSRRSSLMLVFERVCSSTRLTMTAQYSAGVGAPFGPGLPGKVPGTTTE